MDADRDPPARAGGPAHWGSLHDSWQDTKLSGRRGASTAKEPLPVAVIIAIVKHRLGAHGATLGIAGLASVLGRRVESLRPHARDVLGRNWDIPASDATSGMGEIDEADFRRIVDAARDQFDIA